MKKLGILIYSLGSGGAERVLSLLLPKIIKNFQVELFLMADIIHYDIPKDVNITLLENSSPYESGLKKLLKIPFLALRYKQLCKEKNIDISFSLMNRPNYINVLSTILGSSIKTVISERAMPSLEYGKGDIKSLINKTLIRLLYPRADKIITNSIGNKKDLQENFHIKTYIETIYNPIDIKSIQERYLERCDFDFSPYTFITIGRLDSGKNHQMMINAFSKIDNGNAQLIIIGYGVLEVQLKELILALRLEGQVHLVGKQENPYKWLKRSQCFLFSSLHEGFPNVILEALVCELPIITTDPNGVVKEILGESGYVVDSELEMVKMMEQQLEFDSLISLDRFTIDTIFSKYLKILQ